jgi:hypothetical protein
VKENVMKAIYSTLLTVALLFTIRANASTLKLSIEHHAAVVTNGQKRIPLRARFTDEPLIANVKLDVYALPQLPSTSVNLVELKRLSVKTWPRELSWDVRDASGNPQSVQPHLIRTSARAHGPNEANPEDRDTTVECTTFDGSFDLGALSPGDYTVQVSVKGLKSLRFPLAIRTGREPEVRDVYLQEKARKTTDWSQFKALQLERISLDPTKAAALLELAQRSLEFGTLNETNDYFDRAAKTMEQNLEQWAKVNPTDAKVQAPAVQNSVKNIRALQRLLPEYFANRSSWRVSVDATTGQYIVRTRDTNRVVRQVK